MFLKNRQGMDTMQMVVIGIAAAALTTVFVTKILSADKNAANGINSASQSIENKLNRIGP